MNRRTGRYLLGSRLMLAGMLLPGLVCAAEAPPASPPAATAADAEDKSDKQLGEILIEGLKPEKNPQKVIDWMARLVGEFTFEGEVDLAARGRPQDLHPVRGSGNCIGFGPAPAVQCEIDVHWTPVRYEDRATTLGGVSNLEPAMMLFGFEPDRIGIRYMLVDSNGIAEGALGYVVGNTLISRSPCVNIPGQCERVAHITADNDLKFVDMQIDLEIDYTPAVRYHLVMRRVPGSKAVVVSGPKIFAEPEKQ